MNILLLIYVFPFVTWLLFQDVILPEDDSVIIKKCCPDLVFTIYVKCTIKDMYVYLCFSIKFLLPGDKRATFRFAKSLQVLKGVFG